MNTTCSIIVPTHNSSTTIRPCLDAIFQSKHPKDEVIVVDDASKDSTVSLIHHYPTILIQHSTNKGEGSARNSGAAITKYDIIIYIDSDISIEPDSIHNIKKYFYDHPEIAAVTGILKPLTSDENFFSCYKNLYMNYIFLQLNTVVEFLYGSVFAVKKSALGEFMTIPKGTDTEMGLKLTRCGYKIHLMKDLEVTHLKKYSLFSLLKNDFLVPFYWIKIFLLYKKLKTAQPHGFAHCRWRQIFSLLSTCLLCFSGMLIFLWQSAYIPFFLFLFAFLIINYKFFLYIFRKTHFSFFFLSIIFTFIDQLSMSFGIAAGFVANLLSNKNK